MTESAPATINVHLILQILTRNKEAFYVCASQSSQNYV